MGPQTPDERAGIVGGGYTTQTQGRGWALDDTWVLGAVLSDRNMRTSQA